MRTYLSLASLVAPCAAASMILTGVIDGPLNGGVPKAAEFYVSEDIIDLSVFNVASVNNGAGVSGPEFTFPAVSAMAGDFIYVASENDGFAAFFGFEPDYTSGSLSINGDDALLLFENGIIIDVFGDVNMDGSGMVWDYLDGWAYRKSGTGPDGVAFVPGSWTYSGINALDGETTNAGAQTPFPTGTYSPGGDGPGPTAAPMVPGPEPTASPVAVSITFIHDIQGSGDVSPLENQIVTIEGIVTGDFQDDDADANRTLGGFYVQEEESDYDADPRTSEGIFVFDGFTPVVDVNVGDKVQVTGTVDEFFGETQISGSVTINVLSTGNALPAATEIILSEIEDLTLSQSGKYQPDLEAYEGMLVTFPETLQITEMFQLDRFNEIRLVAGERPYQFTQLNEPDDAGYDAYLEELGRRSIVYDDGQNQQNVLISNLEGFPEVYNTETAPRFGDVFNNLNGCLSYTWAGASGSGATWRVRGNGVAPLNMVEYVVDRPEEEPLEDKFEESSMLMVVSLNVLNFFTTIDGEGVSGPNGSAPRGPDSAADYERQLEKMITQMLALDADVFGLVELENEFGDQNGDGLFSIGVVVDTLNSELGSTVYAYVDPGSGYVGGDAIAVGFIYKINRVSLVGSAAILDGTVDARFIDTKNRPVVAQSFRKTESDVCITMAVSHLKSKGSSCQDVGDPDLSNGSGNCNGVRTAAAEAMVHWLDGDATGAGCASLAVLGDLNAYAQEDPIDVFINAGYVNVEADDAYSYVFDGQVGTLDYFLIKQADPSAAFSTMADVWHINEDEADALDYNLDFGRDPAIFDGTSPARASDHSPVIVLLTDQSLVSPPPPPTCTQILGRCDADNDDCCEGFRCAQRLGRCIFSF